VTEAANAWTAVAFEERLDALRPADGRIGMGQIFALAKEFIAMDPREIERLLESPAHEMRVGAVSVMDWQARSKNTTAERRRELSGTRSKSCLPTSGRAT
jgi:hypothetical protein